MPRLVSLAATAALITVSSLASANGGGLAGYTGKQAGQTCNSCHTGGATPTVTITGPSTIAAGQTADFALVVTTGQSRAAGGVAASDGTTLTPGAGFRDSFGEMVQDGARVVSGGSATFAFKVTAPTSGTSLKLWAVGMAANGAGTGGDTSIQISRDIAVTGGTTPGSSTSSTSSSGAASSSSTSSSGGATPPKTGATKAASSSSGDDDDDDDDDDGMGPIGRRPTTTVSSCAAAAGPVDDLAAASLVGLGLVVALTARRRAAREARKERA